MDDLLAGASVWYRKCGPDAGAGATMLIGTASPPGIYGDRLVITQKGQAEFDAALDFVARKPGAEIRQWAEACGLARDPARPYAGLHIVVEDASPDTCMALVLLAARLCGTTVPEAWCDAARQWELGYVPAEPMKSWVAHHSALVHAILVPASAAKTVPEALGRAVAYLRALLKANADPNELAPVIATLDSEGAALHRLAHARLSQERVTYRNIVAHALRAQLSIPETQSARCRLVDAVVLVEQQIEGTMKIFARSDPTSWTGGGYVFNAIYRPSIPDGSGMTFSLAPEAGLTLEPLWRALERREDDAWEGGRPRDAPRSGMVSFAMPREDGLTPSNDPWWDDGGRYTLVAAPGANGVSTKLSWNDTLDEVWRAFAPGRGIRGIRRGRQDSAVSLLMDRDAVDALFEADLEGSPLRLLDFERQSVAHGEPIPWCPTLEMALAAVVNGDRIALHALPDLASFDFLRAGESAIVVTTKGVLLFGSGPDVMFPAANLRRLTAAIAGTLAIAIQLEKRVKEARIATRVAIPSGRAKLQRDALTNLYAIQLLAREHWPSDPPDGGGLEWRFYEACERRWCARRRFDQVLKEAGELEAMIVSAASNQTASILNSIAIYGFALALLGNLLGGAVARMTEAEGDLFDIAWNPVIWFLILALAISIGLRIWKSFYWRRWRKSLDVQSGEVGAKAGETENPTTSSGPPEVD